MGKGQMTDPLFIFSVLLIIFLAIPQGSAGALGGAADAFRNALGSIGVTGAASCPFYTGQTAFQIQLWQCLLIFGLIPFAILYYFTQDLLGFTMLQERTVKMIAIGVALVASMPITNQGTMIAALVDNLVSITGWVTGGGGPYGFFVFIIMLGIITTVLGQVGVMVQSTRNATGAMLETYYGLSLMRQVGKTVTKEK